MVDQHTAPLTQSPHVMTDESWRGALETARAAAADASVVVSEAAAPAEMVQACTLLERLWDEDPQERAMTPLVMRALSYAGNYVATARRDGELLGTCVGFLGRADGWELHSHIAGVITAAQGKHVGFALKTHQRAWALRRGLDRVSWTFDPLVRRNAYFNLCKLATGVRGYHENLYGDMADGINAGDESDRLVADWSLLDDAVTRACAGHPIVIPRDHLLELDATPAVTEDARGWPLTRPFRDGTVLVQIPEDVERLRKTDSGCATAWRAAVRDVLGGLLADGALVVGFSRHAGYVVTTETDVAASSRPSWV